jgi:PAS domain S-box-containing protein
MTTWFTELCSTAFMPHGQCYLWDPGLVWLHAMSDALIALAYFSIPLTLLFIVRQRRDLPFPKIFLMFGAFIVACGTTHLIDVVTVWHPIYWVSGFVKSGTAAISLLTAVALVRSVPAALELPSLDELRRHNTSLEERVAARTADLVAANARLQQEVAQREAAEAEVRRLNATLEDRVAELQALFDALPVGVGISRDNACRSIRTNRTFSAMLGLAPEANASLSAPATEAPTTFHILHGGRRLAPTELPMQRALSENRAVLGFEETIVRADGVQTDVLVNALPLHDDRGRASGVVATFQDISALKRAERERLDFERRLLETQKLESIGVLAGGIAHDFNNLLTAMLGNASLVRLNLPETAVAMRRQLGEVESAAQRAAELCKQLLAYAGQGRYVVQPLDLNRLIEEQTVLLRSSVGKMVTFDIALAPQLRLVRGDHRQLRQVVVSIVTNAAEAIGERPGRVTLRTHLVRLGPADLAGLVPPHDLAPGWCVSLDVSDDGCGMPPETLARIFEPFFTTKFIGRGLGLAAVLGIVRGHKGGLHVASAPGRGTTLRVFLPALDETAPTGETVAPGLPAVAAGPSGGRGTILVADDEAYVRELAHTALAGAGFDVVPAHDGAEAVDLVKATPARFTAIVLDLRMPKIDGENALFAIRLVAPKVPVVLISGFDEHFVHRRFTDRGLAGFVPKPFTAEALVHQVEAAIAKAREAG